VNCTHKYIKDTLYVHAFIKRADTCDTQGMAGDSSASLSCHALFSATVHALKYSARMRERPHAAVYNERMCS
jgi:hypothetical protein